MNHKDLFMQKGFFMLYLSKSKYCKFCQCPKIIWLQKHKPEEEYFDPQSKSLMERGNEIGDLAMGLWGNFVEVAAYKDGKLDLAEMSRRTAREMAKETPLSNLARTARIEPQYKSSHVRTLDNHEITLHHLFFDFASS